MFFIRHGQSTFNVICDRTGRDPKIPDAPLSPLGAEQAKKAAKKVLGLGIKRIISSPYTRALQTASIIADSTGLQIEVEPLVGERRLYSCDIGSPVEILRKNWPTLDFGLLKDGEWWLPFDESHSDLMKRITEFSLKNRADERTEKTLVVSHWYFINAITGATPDNAELIKAPIHP